ELAGSAPSADKGASEAKAPPRILAWRHIGVGLGVSPVYSSRRINLRMPRSIFGPKLPDMPLPDPRKPYAADLGGGVSCLVPLALHADAKGTLPRPDVGNQTKEQAAVDSLVAP